MLQWYPWRGCFLGVTPAYCPGGSSASLLSALASFTAPGSDMHLVGHCATQALIRTSPPSILKAHDIVGRVRSSMLFAPVLFAMRVNGARRSPRPPRGAHPALHVALTPPSTWRLFRDWAGAAAVLDKRVTRCCAPRLPHSRVIRGHFLAAPNTQWRPLHKTRSEASFFVCLIQRRGACQGLSG